jgi:DNA-directed RNA polymerase subunit RPC12/RpoP
MKKKEIIAFYPLLELFSRLNEKDQSILLKHITCDGCDAFLECIHNAMWNDKIDRKDRKIIQRKFKNYKILFRFFNSHKIDPEEKYKELRQEGSGIGSIVGILLPYVKEYCDYHSEDSLKYGDINNDENFPKEFHVYNASDANSTTFKREKDQRSQQVKCPDCPKKITYRNMSRHRKRRHGKSHI